MTGGPIGNTHGYREVDLAPLREAFLRSGLTAADVARALGWIHPCSPCKARRDGRRFLLADSGRVTRALGLRPEAPNGSGYGGRRRVTTSYERAAEMAVAMGFDPVDLDL